MSKSLLLCLTQTDVMSFFAFENTGIKVYSFEEALFHCYYNWMNSLDDFTSDEFIDWVKNSLKLNYLAQKITKLREIENISDRLIKFLTITEYFSNSQIDSIELELKEWLSRLEWERLKIKGDYQFEKGNFYKALELYNLAISKEGNGVLYNNLALTYVKLEDFNMAFQCFEEGYKYIGDNLDFIFNYAETLIFIGDTEKALGLIEKLQNEEDIFYLKGLLESKNENYTESINLFLKAFELSKDEYYIYEISNICTKLKMYPKALEVLNNINNLDSKYYLKKSEILVLDNKVRESIENLEKATKEFGQDIDLWIALAKNYRINKDYMFADGAIEKALEIDDTNEYALLEKAEIKNDQGKIKDFRSLIHCILDKFKTAYRDNIS